MLLKPAAAIALVLAAAGCRDGERTAPEADSKAAPEAEAPSGEAALGEKMFGQCAICHSAPPPGSAAARTGLIGPSLWGVVGRPAASLEGYDYSDAMRAPTSSGTKKRSTPISKIHRNSSPATA